MLLSIWLTALFVADVPAAGDDESFVLTSAEIEAAGSALTGPINSLRRLASQLRENTGTAICAGGPGFVRFVVFAKSEPEVLTIQRALDTGKGEVEFCAPETTQPWCGPDPILRLEAQLEFQDVAFMGGTKALPGDSCKRSGGRAGTAGALVHDLNGNPRILGNSHVFAPTIDAWTGDRITFLDGRRGQLTQWRELNFRGRYSTELNGQNTVDAALVEIENPRTVEKKTHRKILDQNTLLGLLRFGLRVGVTKSSIESDRGYGEIECVGASVNVGGARFHNQIVIESRPPTDPAFRRKDGDDDWIIEPFAEPGDSGSLVKSQFRLPLAKPFTAWDDRPVGLLFAGNADGTLTFANPIAEVLCCLGASLTSAPVDRGCPTGRECEHPTDAKP